MTDGSLGIDASPTGCLRIQLDTFIARRLNFRDRGPGQVDV